MRSENDSALLRQSPYADILAMMPQGAANAKHSRDFARSLGMRDRAFRKCLEYLRRNGIVIIGSSSGYYFPADLEELNAYIRQEEASAKSLLFTLKSARNLREQWENRLFNHSIFDHGGNNND